MYTMADKVELQQPDSLTCPLCLDAFKKPTLLRCGHTFCNICLNRYDEQHDYQDYMECPVCKKRTKLGRYRVSGLAPNFSVKGLEDELHQGKVEGGSSNFCSFHSNIYKDILCEDCEEFVCLSCFLDKHQGHKIKKKEEIEADLKKKRDALKEKSKAKKFQIRNLITNAEQHKRHIDSHLEKLETEIQDSFEKKAEILRKNKRRLSEGVDKIRKDAYKIVNMGIDWQKQSMDNINSHLTLPKGNGSKCVDSDELKALRVQLTDLENELEKDIGEASMTNAKEKVRNTRFCPVEGNILDLGRLEQRAKAMESEPPQVNTWTGPVVFSYAVTSDSDEC